MVGLQGEWGFALDKELGLGLLGSVDAVWLGDGLREKGLLVERQKPIAICFRGERFEEGFWAEWLLGDLVLVE